MKSWNMCYETNKTHSSSRLGYFSTSNLKVTKMIGEKLTFVSPPRKRKNKSKKRPRKAHIKKNLCNIFIIEATVWDIFPWQSGREVCCISKMSYFWAWPGGPEFKSLTKIASLFVVKGGIRTQHCNTSQRAELLESSLTKPQAQSFKANNNLVHKSMPY